MASTEAYQKFIHFEPSGVIEHKTLEIHSENNYPTQRFVLERLAKVFALEAGAPRDAGQFTFFLPAGGIVEEPEVTSQGDINLSITVAGGTPQVQELINALADADDYEVFEVIYRKYLSTEPGEPAVPPLYLELSSINVQGVESVTLVATDKNSRNKRAGLYYLPQFFEGLRE